MAARQVTWCPRLVSVSRPSSVRKRSLRRSSSTFVVLAIGGSKKVDGEPEARFRGEHTRSLLLTLPQNKRHRALQLLIDLPHRRLRRVYCDQRTWNIVEKGSVMRRNSRLGLQCHLGTISWHDGERRHAASRGFRLDWLNGLHEYDVEEASLVPIPNER